MNQHADLPTLLRRWRSRHKLSQGGAAEKLGVSRRAIEAWEQGINRPRGLGLAALLAAIKT